jgi:5' nucleotidase, deoxy (Pyrimidine), cytosolic type C protein (NT5C)
MPLRVAFDMDGVLADMEAALVKQTARLFGEAPTDDADPAPDERRTAKPRMTARQERRLWEHVRTIENFWESLPEIEPGMVARLNGLAIERGWEVIFLTKRPATKGVTAQLQTQRWLEAHGFALPSVYVVQGSRGAIAAALALDFVIDDRPENCLDVATDSKARAILVWRNEESQLPDAFRRLGIGVVRSVGQCLDILSQIQDSEGPPGMMTRVLRLLGLKEPAEA